MQGEYVRRGSAAAEHDGVDREGTVRLQAELLPGPALKAVSFHRGDQLTTERVIDLIQIRPGVSPSEHRENQHVGR